MTRHITRLLKQEEREGAPPARDVTDRLREYRQTTVALTEYQSVHASDLEARRFLDDLNDCLDRRR